MLICQLSGLSQPLFIFTCFAYVIGVLLEHALLLLLGMSWISLMIKYDTWNFLKFCLFSVLDQYTPLKAKFSKRSTLWVTPELLLSIEEKKNLTACIQDPF